MVLAILLSGFLADPCCASTRYSVAGTGDLYGGYILYRGSNAAPPVAFQSDIRKPDLRTDQLAIHLFAQYGSLYEGYTEGLIAMATSYERENGMSCSNGGHDVQESNH
jgi:hypothetical protein